MSEAQHLDIDETVHRAISTYRGLAEGRCVIVQAAGKDEGAVLGRKSRAIVSACLADHMALVHLEM